MMNYDYILKDAVLGGQNNEYRYSLIRNWDENKEKMLFMLFNPSTADSLADDNTVKSCVRLAKNGGYGGIHIVNLFAYRATSPKELIGKTKEKLVGDDWLNYISVSLKSSSKVVLGWGNLARELINIKRYDRDKEVAEYLDKNGIDYYCYELTQKGCPKHPLYISSDSRLQKIKWTGRKFESVI